MLSWVFGPFKSSHYEIWLYSEAWIPCTPISVSSQFDWPTAKYHCNFQRHNRRLDMIGPPIPKRVENGNLKKGTTVIFFIFISPFFFFLFILYFFFSFSISRAAILDFLRVLGFISNLNFQRGWMTIVWKAWVWGI